MKNDFKPVVGHRFNLRGDWGGVLDCEVLAVEPNKTLSYTWNFAHDDAAYNLKSVVTFTLTPTSTGTHLRMEQSGFRPDQKQAYGGAKAGGSSSSRTWSRSWRGQIEVCRRSPIRLRLVIQEEVSLNWNNWIRQIHRWLSDCLYGDRHRQLRRHGTGGTCPPGWSTRRCSRSSLLLFTGLYMFVLPYAAKWRSARRVGG